MPPLHKVIRLRDLPNFVGLQRTQVEQLIAEGRFPKPVRLSTRRIAWLESEIIAWQQSRIAERDQEEGI
jgi:prophage regulatory protein